MVKFTKDTSISLITEGYAEQLKERYGDLKQDILGKIQILRALISTNALHGFEADLNEVLSSPRLMMCQGVGNLAGRFEGFPGILVSTGPSLGRNIHHLRKAQGSALIIAAGQALRPLLAYGVKPDLISYLDFQDHAIDHLKGLMGRGDIPLVTMPKVCHPLVQQWQGPLLVAGAEDKNAFGCLHDIWKQKGEMRIGISVAHFNLVLAKHLKLDPVILVGQDFAVNDEFTHFDQVDHRHKIKFAEGNRIVTRMDDEKALNKGLELNRGEIYTLPGYFGGQVRTFNNLLAQWEQFRGILEAGPGRVINCTEGGARIDYTEQMRLGQAIETYCTRSIPGELLGLLSQKDQAAQELLGRGLPLLKQELGGLWQIQKMAASAIRANRKFRSILDRPALSPKEAARINALSRKSRDLSQDLRLELKKTPYLHESLFWVQQEIKAEMEQKRGRGEDETRILLDADHRFAEKTVERADGLAQAYSRAVDLLERHEEDRRVWGRAQKDPEAVFNLAETLRDMGQSQESLELMGGILKDLPLGPDYWHEYARVCLDLERFGQAREALEKLSRMDGPDPDVSQLRKALRKKTKALLNGAAEDMEAGFLARALLDLWRFLEAEPDSTQAREMARECQGGLAQKEIKADQEAARAWAGSDAAAKNRDYDRILAEINGLDQARRRSPQALELFRSAVEMNPARPEARWGMATTLCLLGRFQEALPLYQGLVADDPDNHFLRLELAWLLVRLERPGEAQEVIAPVVEKAASEPALAPLLGEFFQVTQKYDRALGYYEQHLQANKKDFAVWTKRGDCLAQLGQTRKAAGSYRTALSINPEYVVAAGRLERVRSPQPGQAAAGAY